MEQYQILALCRRYGFSCVDVGLYYRIVSNRDEWYIKKRSGDEERYELKHDSTGWQNTIHLQGHFNSLEKVFQYIHNHDWRELYSAI